MNHPFKNARKEAKRAILAFIIASSIVFTFCGTIGVGILVNHPSDSIFAHHAFALCVVLGFGFGVVIGMIAAVIAWNADGSW